MKLMWFPIIALVAVAGCATSTGSGTASGPTGSLSHPLVQFSPTAQPVVAPCGNEVFTELRKVVQGHFLTAAFQVSISAEPRSSSLPGSKQSFVTLPVEDATLLAGDASNGPLQEIVWVVNDSSQLPKNFWLEPGTYVLLVDVPPGASKDDGYGWYGYAPGENASFVVRDGQVTEECSAQSAADPARFAEPPEGGSESMKDFQDDLGAAFAGANTSSESP
jgi:hypothetical protein